MVIPLAQHQDSLQLPWHGETLKGPGLIAAKTRRVSFVRSGPPRRIEGAWRLP
jgi:hypothetical protein